MLFDLKKNEFPSSDRYNLAIVGAGAAGISIAREFSGIPHRVLLIESGDFESDRQTQDLYRGETEGNLPGNDDYLHTSRLRFFGGSTNHWNGWCRPLDPIDFEKREWVPNSGWPISKNDLEPNYRRAEKLVGINSFRQLDQEQFDWTSADMTQMKVRAPYFQFSSPPTRFGQQYRDDVLQSENIDIIINANLRDIRLNDRNSRVSTIHLSSLNQHEAEFQVDFLVLACGGIENPRILMNCRNDIPAGIGNQNGLVGKYFLEHPHYYRTSAWLVTWNVVQLKKFLNRVQKRIRYELNEPSNTRVFSITERAQREEKLLNISMEVLSSSYLENSELNPQEKTFTQAVNDLSKKLLIDKNMLENAQIAKVYIRAEQEPTESNSVTITDEKDELGMQRVKLKCQVSNHEVENYRQSLKLLGRAFGLDQKGRIRIDMNHESYVAGGAHHMGTTRMSSNPQAGVVDSNCAVHGVDNLFIAGSSVFPTAGFANPTLTILALGLRLADHLKTLLKNE